MGQLREDIQTPTLLFDSDVVPAPTGPNDIPLTAPTPGGAPKDTLEMTAQFSDPSVASRRSICPCQPLLIPIR